MPSLRGFSGNEVIKILQHMGFVLTRIKGSHAVLRNGASVCVVPLHDELAGCRNFIPADIIFRGD
ncbi:MAG: type II toxin-antitoxin system HicA family toxin [Synergistales bacterium]|nr:type II toxin-antitoxin system HicA family toxin [Synergistales bacterium]MDY6402171.1 type II toxin-antitoxin system HicA family toxin [Synergistales bacterium]MDY6404486.1 type II toxin-antitoxin system HicA family toxin [Synergistales bacterium]MDY6410558.1 type II toxin-antitoxin system HicA family toxin [Synergistales bacterium]MDY6413689.1 type II toxin-antitoxin system HicA family toxin [Synergistales bacterium]